MKTIRLILAAVLGAAFVSAGCTKPAEQTPSGEDNKEETPQYQEGKTTVFSSFSFTVAANEGKILAKDVVYDGYRTKTKAVKEKQLTIGADGSISGMIPYLFDFKLVPTWKLKDNGEYEVYVGNELQKSGESEVDFAKPVVYRIVDKAAGVQSSFTVTLTNTGLPVVVLTQKGDYYPTESFVDMNVPAKTCAFGETDEISIWQNGEEVLKQMNCGYRMRGNITRQYPKKAFALKLAKKSSVLGMKAHKRWALLANWKDNTQMRNDLALHLAREFKGMAWNPQGRYVELVLNGEHVGLYYLCEQIKIDENRIAINEPYDKQSAPTFENCGYLLEFDNYFDEPYKFRINGKKTLPVNCKDDFDNSANGQAIFKALQDRLTLLDNKISGGKYSEAYELLDIDAAVDYMLLQELVMNNEYKHPRSVYAWMNGGADKLHFGPCWDYDVWTFPDVEKMRYYNYESYVHQYDKFQFQTEVMNTSSTYVWFKLLMKDSSYKEKVRKRWAELSAIEAITPDAVDAYIESLYEGIKTSVECNREMWPHPSGEYTDDYMNGDETTGSRGSGKLYSYRETLDILKTAYRKRFEGMASATR